MRELIIKGAAMMCALYSVLPASAASDAYEVVLPSGITASFVEVVTTDLTEGLTYRFRFAANDLPETAEAYEKLESDMMYLCENYALDRLPDPGPRPKHVVISIASAVEKFGDYNPDITQFFDSFDVSGGSCEWEFY